MDPFTWIIIAIVVIMAILMVALMPKPKFSVETKFDVPTTEQGTPIGVLFGTRRLNQISIAWWGHLQIILEEIDSSGKKG